jgi:hypothetical protein
MSMHEQPTLAPPTTAEPTGTVLRLVTDAYRLLADIHDAIARATPHPAEAQEHVTSATRELAAIQRIFERRGR